MKTHPQNLVIQRLLATFCLLGILLAIGCETKGPLVVEDGQRVASYDVTGLT